MAPRKDNNGRKTVLGSYKSYNFKDHDPVLDHIDRVRELAGNGEGLLSAGRTSAASGVSEGTISNWHNRKVKRPQFASVAAVVRGLGAQILIVYKGKSIRVKGID